MVEPVAAPVVVATPPVVAETTLRTEAPAEAPKVETPKVETPPVETSKVEAKVETPKEEPSLLEGAAKEPLKVEAKAPEPAKVDAQKDAQEAAKEAPKEEAAKAPEPIKYDFKLPDGVKLDAEPLGKFTEILGKGAVSPEVGQQILDLYTAEVQAAAQSLQTIQKDSWEKTNQGWKDAVKADPEIGGNRLETVLQTGASLIERFGGKPEEKAALRRALTLTGAGNHPEVVRFFSRVGKELAEPSPVPATTPPKAPASRADRRYGSNGAAT